MSALIDELGNGDSFDEKWKLHQNVKRLLFIIFYITIKLNIVIPS